MKMNKREQKANTIIKAEGGYILGGIINTFMDYNPETEEYQNAVSYLCDTEELIKDTYDEAVGSAEDIRFCGKDWLMEQCRAYIEEEVIDIKAEFGLKAEAETFEIEEVTDISRVTFNEAVEATLYVYEDVYDYETSDTAECVEVTLYDVIGYDTVSGETARREIEARTDGSCLDECGTYIVIRFADGRTSAYRDSHCCAAFHFNENTTSDTRYLSTVSYADEAETKSPKRKALEAMGSIVDERMTAYKKDYNVDVDTIRHCTDNYIIWCVRPTGTHIITETETMEAATDRGLHSGIEGKLHLNKWFYLVDLRKGRIKELTRERAEKVALTPSYFDECGNEYRTYNEAVAYADESYSRMESADLRKYILGLKQDYVPAVYFGADSDIDEVEELYSVADWCCKYGAAHVLARKTTCDYEEYKELCEECGATADSYDIIKAYYLRHKA